MSRVNVSCWNYRGRTEQSRKQCRLSVIRQLPVLLLSHSLQIAVGGVTLTFVHPNPSLNSIDSRLQWVHSRQVRDIPTRKRKRVAATSTSAIRPPRSIVHMMQAVVQFQRALARRDGIYPSKRLSDSSLRCSRFHFFERCITDIVFLTPS